MLWRERTRSRKKVLKIGKDIKRRRRNGYKEEKTTSKAENVKEEED
jgi:hypothetical protein